MEPNKGYRAGGTKVTIAGEHLDIGSQVRVMVNNTHECVITEWVQLVLLLSYSLKRTHKSIAFLTVFKTKLLRLCHVPNFAGKQMMSLNAPCQRSRKPMPTLWVCVWSLKTSPVNELILPPSTPIKRTPPSSLSNPPRATSGMSAPQALKQGHSYGMIGFHAGIADRNPHSTVLLMCSVSSLSFFQ